MSNRYRDYYSNITPDKKLVAETLRKMHEIESDSITAAPSHRIDIRPFAAVAACAAAAVSAVIFGPDFNNPDIPSNDDFAVENTVTTSETEPTTVISPSESFTSVISYVDSESSSDSSTEESKETAKTDSETGSTSAASDTKPSAGQHSTNTDANSNSTHKTSSETQRTDSPAGSKPASAVQTEIFTTVNMTTADKSEENSYTAARPEDPELTVTYAVTTAVFTEAEPAEKPADPAVKPTSRPTARPTVPPTSRPTARPTTAPTAHPTKRPAESTPAEAPDRAPTCAPAPTLSPTAGPGWFPTKSPAATMAPSSPSTEKPADSPDNSTSTVTPEESDDNTVTFTEIYGKKFAVNNPYSYNTVTPVYSKNISYDMVTEEFGSDILGSRITDMYGEPECTVSSDYDRPENGVVMIFGNADNAWASSGSFIMIAACSSQEPVYGMFPEYSSYASRTEYNGTYYTVGYLRRNNMYFMEFYKKGIVYTLAFKGYSLSEAVNFADSIS